MPRMNLKVTIDEDRNSAIIELYEEETLLGHIIYDASTLDQLISELARIRAELRDVVTPELEPFSRVSGTDYPAWRVPDQHSGPPGTALLTLRHPGLGWLAFLLEPERADDIARALVDYRNPPARDKAPSRS
ncbi:hypothetical protein [Bauldia sp.]|uniref:hypothetical protein n=1 Tax=Bauldia sp. TaxID=2575872 RepID=UPI003BA8CC78